MGASLVTATLEARYAAHHDWRLYRALYERATCSCSPQQFSILPRTAMRAEAYDWRVKPPLATADQRITNGSQMLNLCIATLTGEPLTVAAFAPLVW
jgi:hypothetical protein